MNVLSVSIVLGSGSERHNHDNGYRLSLDHVLAMNGGEVELTPYIVYNTRINELMKPAIDEYNTRRQEKYYEAMNRYERGELKTKPKKQAYQLMSYDYARDHERRYMRNPSTNRVEAVPLYRELIIKLGNIKDRVSGKLLDDIAILICGEIVAKFDECFQLLNILGCTLHVNELGAIHLHMDFIPIAKKLAWKNGLPVSLSLNVALEQMGFVPENSIMCTKTERAPILFNALRNRVYQICEEVLINHGYRMQYEATALNYPSLDPSESRSLHEFQFLSDHARWIQHNKILAQEFLQEENLQFEDLTSAMNAYQRITESVFAAKNVASQVCEFGYEVTEDLLFAFHSCCVKIVEKEVEKARELNTSITSATANVRELLHTLNELKAQCNMMSSQKRKLEEEIEALRVQIPQLQYKNAIGSQRKKYTAGYQLVSKREFNALVRVAECVNEISDENKKLIEKNNVYKRNVEYLEQCNLRMENLLKQYAPPNAEQDIRRVKRELTEMAVRDYYNNELAKIEKGRNTLGEIATQTTKAIGEVGAVINAEIEKKHADRVERTKLDVQVKTAELKAAGKHMLSVKEMSMVQDFGRLIGLRHEEIEQLVDYALFGSKRGQQQAWKVWQESKKYFWDNYRTEQQKISSHLDDLIRMRWSLRQAEWLIHPNNTQKSLWGVLFAIILRLSTHTSLTEVEAEIAYYKAARERLHQYTQGFLKAAEGIENLNDSDFKIEEYIDAVSRMNGFADLVAYAVLDIPLEDQYVIMENCGMVSKAELQKRVIENGRV